MVISYPAVNNEKPPAVPIDNFLITLPRRDSYLAIPVVLCVPAKEAHGMAKVLKDLFYGDLSLSDQPMPKGSVMHKVGERICKSEETLEELLDEKGKEQLKILSDAQLELNSLTAEENFILGFRLGVRLMAECLTGEEDA